MYNIFNSCACFQKSCARTLKKNVAMAIATHVFCFFRRKTGLASEEMALSSLTKVVVNDVRWLVTLAGGTESEAFKILGCR